MVRASFSESKKTVSCLRVTAPPLETTFRSRCSVKSVVSRPEAALPVTVVRVSEGKASSTRPPKAVTPTIRTASAVNVRDLIRIIIIVVK